MGSRAREKLLVHDIVSAKKTLKNILQRLEPCEKHKSTTKQKTITYICKDEMQKKMKMKLSK